MAAGDVYAPALSLGLRSTGGAGFTFTSAKNEETSVFERINLRGELPLGYDVELMSTMYCAPATRAGVRQGATNSAMFLCCAAATSSGSCCMGRGASERKQTPVVNVGGGHLPKGQLQIDGGIVSQDRPLVQFSDDVVPLAQGRGDVRAVLNLAYGYHRRSRRRPVPVATPTWPAGADNGADLCMRMSLLGFALQADGARDLDGGSALASAWRAHCRGFVLSLRHVRYGGAFITTKQRLAPHDRCGGTASWCSI